MGINSPLLSISPISMMTRGKREDKFNSSFISIHNVQNALKLESQIHFLNSQLKSLLMISLSNNSTSSFQIPPQFLPVSLTRISKL